MFYCKMWVDVEILLLSTTYNAKNRKLHVELVVIEFIVMNSSPKSSPIHFSIRCCANTILFLHFIHQRRHYYAVGFWYALKSEKVISVTYTHIARLGDQKLKYIRKIFYGHTLIHSLSFHFQWIIFNGIFLSRFETMALWARHALSHRILWKFNIETIYLI